MDKGNKNEIQLALNAIIGDIEPEVETPPVYPITFATMDDRNAQQWSSL